MAVKQSLCADFANVISEAKMSIHSDISCLEKRYTPKLIVDLPIQSFHSSQHQKTTSSLKNLKQKEQLDIYQECVDIIWSFIHKRMKRNNFETANKTLKIFVSFSPKLFQNLFSPKKISNSIWRIELETLNEIKEFFSEYRRNYQDVYAELVPPIQLQVNLKKKTSEKQLLFHFNTRLFDTIQLKILILNFVFPYMVLHPTN